MWAWRINGDLSWNYILVIIANVSVWHEQILIDLITLQFRGDVYLKCNNCFKFPKGERVLKLMMLFNTIQV